MRHVKNSQPQQRETCSERARTGAGFLTGNAVLDIPPWELPEGDQRCEVREVAKELGTRIAQVAPLVESVPPKQYGGTERVVSWLTEELVRLGHHVTLFASGDSETSTELVACCPRRLRSDGLALKEADLALGKAACPIPHYLIMLDRLSRRASEFNIIHFHIDYLHFPVFRSRATNTLTTTHGRLDLPYLAPLFSEFPEFPLVSISDDQRKPVAWANWISTVHHGMPKDLLPYQQRPSLDYLAFLGRASPEKGLERAIEIASRAGMKLRMAAKLDEAETAYFRKGIEPLLRQPHVEFMGEIDDAAKSEFLGNAVGLLFPIDWPEPFGLVMIEAMASGTPVIAYRRGSVPEVIENGVTGFVVEDEDEAVIAVKRLRMLNRRMVRARFEERFSVERMARDYLDLYRELASPVARRARDIA